MASASLRPVLEGPRRRGSVLASFSSAVYVDIGPRADPRMVALVGSSGVRLPVAAALPRSAPALAVIPTGTPAVAGRGELSVGDVRVRVTRWWDPVPRIGSVASATLRGGVSDLRGLLDSVGAPPGIAGHAATGLLASACSDGDLARIRTAATGLVGLGPGLTPSGDDMLAGVLVSLRLLGTALRDDNGGRALSVPAVDALATGVTDDAANHTTPIAATLLRCAARGEAATEVGGVVRALAGHERLEPAVRRLLAIGHTSGADLAWGLLEGSTASLSLTRR